MAKAIMVQGTMSNVGKSLLVAGLCRILARRGLRVAPFKSQNMALNSGVTRDGREIGRAQIIQAHAAGIEPDDRMNPILLKPTSDTGSQVIVRGEPVATMGARDYADYRRSLRSVVLDAYLELARDFDVIVIEGAGSPAEINLAADSADDIVNMGMAHMASAPVILVGDIDPGGVFAQITGTLGLLDPADRALVRGVVINKFRGDLSILLPGLDQLERLGGVPVLGVVPYLRIDLGDEDSLSARISPRANDLRRTDAPVKLDKQGVADIAVIRLPHLSNFTDFDQLDRHPRARVRYVGAAGELGRPDLVVLPGTKSTLADLRWLRSTGLARCICALAAQQTPVLGICGGYQMLGRELVDEVGDDGGGCERGLSLLPATTSFAREKRLVEVAGSCSRRLPGFFSCLAGLPVRGYEVHMGTTSADQGQDQELEQDQKQEQNHERNAMAAHAHGSKAIEAIALSSLGGEGDAAPHLDGMACGNVMGTYVHGLFDAPGMSEAIVNACLERRGLPASSAKLVDARSFESAQLDLLADQLEASLDIAAVLRILDEGTGERTVR